MPSKLKEEFIRLFQSSGLSYSDLSALSGVSTATISRFVNGWNISVENLELLIAALEKYTAEHGPSSAPEASSGDDMPVCCKFCRDFNAALKTSSERHDAMLREFYEQRIVELKASYEREFEFYKQEIVSYKKYVQAIGIFLAITYFTIFAMVMITWALRLVGWNRLISEMCTEIY